MDWLRAAEFWGCLIDAGVLAVLLPRLGDGVFGRCCGGWLGAIRRQVERDGAVGCDGDVEGLVGCTGFLDLVALGFACLLGLIVDWCCCF